MYSFHAHRARVFPYLQLFIHSKVHCNEVNTYTRCLRTEFLRGKLQNILKARLITAQRYIFQIYERTRFYFIRFYFLFEFYHFKI